METEQRKYVRYRVQDDSLQVYNRDSRSVGWIRDIGQGGLSYEYLSVFVDTENAPTIDILSSVDPHLLLQNISLKIIYDTDEIDNTDEHGIASFRRCGVQFEKLTEPLQSQLIDIINNHSVEPIN